MAAEDNSSPASRYSALGIDPTLYPDLVEAGGLAPAMRHLAAEHGIELGEISAPAWASTSITEATIEMAGGSIYVVIRRDFRSFSLNLSRTGRVQADGVSGDLLCVVKAADAWREGASLARIAELFPFVSYDGLAAAFEKGAPAPFQWDRLLGDAELYEIRPLLMAARDHESLGQMFATVTHYVSLFLQMDPVDQSRGGIWIRMKDDGYTIEPAWSHEVTRVHTIVDALAAAEQALRAPGPPLPLE